MKVNLFDSHVHSDNSPDGHHAIPYLCEQAIQNRIMGFAVTDHMECDDKNAAAMEMGVRQAAFEVERSRSSFGNAVRLSKGIELAQGHRCPEFAEHILSLTDFDFVLGSVHTTPDGTDFYYADFSNPALVVSELLTEYYTDLNRLAVWNRFDAMAHIRYPERYIWGEHRIPVDIHPYMEQIEQLLRTLIQNGKALEVNTAGLRKGLGAPDPGREILELYRQLGGELITLGSDAHFAEHMADGFDDTMDLLLTLGYRYFAFYSNRKPVMLRII
ncbi:MAG: histidinol-phosphatase HisJ family protein [Angelakisella sp.]